MPVLCYLDGSGQPDTSQTWTLACVAAPMPTWQAFEREWQELLAAYGLRTFHSTDWASLGKDFSRRRGWDETKCIRLLCDIVALISKFRAVRLHAYCCSVLMDEYERAKRDDPKLKSPESLCVDFCVGALRLTKQELAEPHPIELFFDRGERFMHPIYQAWRRGRKRKTWRDQIGRIQKADSSSPGIQIADLYAWAANRHLTHGDCSFVAAATLIALPCVSHVYRYDGIRSVYNGQEIRPGPHDTSPLKVNLAAEAFRSQRDRTEDLC